MIEIYFGIGFVLIVETLRMLHQETQKVLEFSDLHLDYLTYCAILWLQ